MSPVSYNGEYLSHDNAALAPSSGTLDAGALFVSGDVSMGECTTRWGFDDNMVCLSSAFLLFFDTGVSFWVASRACVLCLISWVERGGLGALVLGWLVIFVTSQLLQSGCCFFVWLFYVSFLGPAPISFVPFSPVFFPGVCFHGDVFHLWGFC